MKKKIKLITIAAFLVLAVPISIMLYNHTDSDAIAIREGARLVETENEFAEALKTDGVIFAKGQVTGKADTELLRQGTRDLLNPAILITDLDGVLDRVIDGLRGNFLRLELHIGHIEWETGDEYSLDKVYSAYAAAETVEFLGQQFNAEPILSTYSTDETIVEPENDSYDGYRLEMLRNPLKGWLRVKVENGSVAESEMQLITEEAMQHLKDAAEGKDSKTSTIAGFLIFWLILMGIVLYLENRFFKSKEAAA